MKLVSIHKHMIVFALFIGGIQPGHAQTWSLQACLDTAQVYNKSLQIGRNNIEISSERQDEATSSLLPRINVNADYKYFTNLPYQLLPLSVFGGPDGQFKEAQFGVPHNINVNGQLTVPIYNPQIHGAIRSTEVALDIAELQYQKTEEQLFFEISNLYWRFRVKSPHFNAPNSPHFNAAKSPL